MHPAFRLRRQPRPTLEVPVFQGRGTGTTAGHSPEINTRNSRFIPACFPRTANLGRSTATAGVPVGHRSYPPSPRLSKESAQKKPPPGWGRNPPQGGVGGRSARYDSDEADTAPTAGRTGGGATAHLTLRVSLPLLPRWARGEHGPRSGVHRAARTRKSHHHKSNLP